MSYIEKEKLIKADIASIENRVRHAFNQGYDLGYKEGKANCSKNSTGSTTKNDLGVDCISRAQAQTEIEMNAYRYTLAKERGGVGEVEWNSHLIDINDAVDIIRNLPSVTPQEPILDKIREQIKDYLRGVEITLEVLVENDPLRPKMEGAKDTLEECLDLIDKAEAEADNG